MAHETRKVPIAALRCVVGRFELGDNGENARSAPFRMVARSGDAIDHWFWGRVVHDFSGMRHKDKIAIDYVHDEKEIIGYANRFSTSEGDLIIKGALTPYDENDRASEVLHKAQAGVPYEASINFGGDGIVIDEYEDGDQVEVNGREFSGPITVIREWPLRGVAVCPYGADAQTSAEFSADHLQEIAVMDSAKFAPEPEALEGTPPVEGATDNDSAVEVTSTVEAVPTELVAEALSEHTGQDFLEAFGDQGGVWYAQGRSFAEAQELYVTALRLENEELRRKLTASQAVAGEAEPIDFDAEKDEAPRGFASRIRIK